VRAKQRHEGAVIAGPHPRPKFSIHISSLPPTDARVPCVLRHRQPGSPARSSTLRAKPTDQSKDITHGRGVSTQLTPLAEASYRHGEHPQPIRGHSRIPSQSVRRPGSSTPPFRLRA
jgi:hypothetical protein